MSDEDLKIIEHDIDLLLAGKFTDVETSDLEGSPLLQKVKQLAAKSVERSEENLRRTVDYSITSNKGMSSVARMSRYISDVNDESQSIASAIEELASSVQIISGSAEQASGEVNQVADSAAAGIVAADNATKAMNQIADTVHDAGSRVDALAKTSEEIGKIVKDIDDIAKQTNLLALNATIEAARAGEAGKGFAVVASEVKSLASQTATATDTIRSRIAALQDEMHGIVSTMEAGEDVVNEGRQIIKTSADEMHGISKQVDSVNTHMYEINSILEQQVQATSEVSIGAGVIADKSHQNSESIKEVMRLLSDTEKPIAESINYFTSKSGFGATLHAAKSDHVIWMRQLSQMLAGGLQLEASDLVDHHSCRLGQWYDSQKDERLTGLSEWRQLEKPHKEVHAAGIKAVEFMQNRDISSALQHVQVADKASAEVLTLIDGIINKIKT